MNAAQEGEAKARQLPPLPARANNMSMSSVSLDYMQVRQSPWRMLDINNYSKGEISHAAGVNYSSQRVDGSFHAARVYPQTPQSSRSLQSSKQILLQKAPGATVNRAPLPKNARSTIKPDD